MKRAKDSHMCFVDRIDRADSQLCKIRAGYKCIYHDHIIEGSRCNGRLECHHIINREEWATRFDPRNHLCVCKDHHDALQGDRFEREMWMAERGITRVSEHRLTDEDLRKLANEREKELKALKDNQWSQ